MTSDKYHTEQNKSRHEPFMEAWRCVLDCTPVPHGATPTGQVFLTTNYNYIYQLN